MSEAKSDQELRKMAERHVDAKQGFRIHATVYVLVNVGLATLNLVTSPHVWWFVWPLLGWGIGLGVHAWAVYGGMGAAREEAIARELRRLREIHGAGPPGAA
jgi:hypothetical protein